MADRYTAEVGGLGRFVRGRRRKLGLSQEKLAMQVGTSREYLSQLEAGKIRWPQTYVRPLARELGITEVEMAVAAGLISDPALEVEAA